MLVNNIQISSVILSGENDKEQSAQFAFNFYYHCQSSVLKL